MRILYVIQRYGEDVAGGAEQYCREIAERMAARGHEIDVLAWRWNWQFTHANGVTDSDLHVPVNTPVRLVMTSKDVLHAFYAPAMRVNRRVSMPAIATMR